MPQQRFPTPIVSWMYDVILGILSLAVHLFFRDVQVKGAWRIPTHGPVILVAAPHSNQVRVPLLWQLVVHNYTGSNNVLKVFIVC
jgi:glycerol-3-phosphate O-acyltransferase/dihydroxyacetone phosphate acyltransferase